jgi:transposase
MDAIEQLQRDLREGRIDAARLCDVISTLQQQVHSAQQQLHSAQQQLQTAHLKIEELEKKLGVPVTTKLDKPFSLKAEEKRQKQRNHKGKPKPSKKGRRGRLSGADKLRLAVRTVLCYPDGVPKADCSLSHTRPLWRLENGQAVIVAYAIYRGPHNQYGKIPGVLGRSEFGLEIVIKLAYLVYVMGLSFDKACLTMQFFQNLKLSKSQADALLKQLAYQWRNEFEVLCTLLANSLVVHADETSWSINSVWAFLSEKARVLLFGVNKDAATLEKILDPSTFAGLVISDDAAVYANFSQSQKCWAHLLRKAIKLTLLEPENLEYRHFLDQFLEIYRKACRVQKDGRLRAAGRAAKVRVLENEILVLCAPQWSLALPPLKDGPANDYRLLVNEVMRLNLAQELFPFVTAEPVTQPNGQSQPVSGTNNEAERTLRNPAQARKTGRTNKTIVGARRQTIVVSVLESLRVYLKEFTLTTVMEEINRWAEAGQSCFCRLLKQCQLTVPQTSVLDQVLPLPDGT